MRFVASANLLSRPTTSVLSCPVRAFAAQASSAPSAQRHFYPPNRAVVLPPQFIIFLHQFPTFHFQAPMGRPPNRAANPPHPGPVRQRQPGGLHDSSTQPAVLGIVRRAVRSLAASWCSVQAANSVLDRQFSPTCRSLKNICWKLEPPPHEVGEIFCWCISVNEVFLNLDP